MKNETYKNKLNLGGKEQNNFNLFLRAANALAIVTLRLECLSFRKLIEMVPDFLKGGIIRGDKHILHLLGRTHLSGY
jgi:hypothetical protein